LLSILSTSASKNCEKSPLPREFPFRNNFNPRARKGAFLVFGLNTPTPEFRGILRETGPRSPINGAQGSEAPLGDETSSEQSAKVDRTGRTSSEQSAKADHGGRTSPERSAKAGRADFRRAKRQSRPRRWDFSRAKCESRPRRSDFCKAKLESRPGGSDFPKAKWRSLAGRGAGGGADGAAPEGPRRGGGRGGRGPGKGPPARKKNGPGAARTAARRKRASTYARNANPARRRRIKNDAKTTLFLILRFRRKRAKMALRRKNRPPRWEKAPAENPDRRPARHSPRRPSAAPNDRDRLPARPQPAARFRPRRPAPASLLQEALWVPTTTDPFRPGPRREARKGKAQNERRNPE